MTIMICPRCKRRYTVSQHCGDFVHECNSGHAALDEEDVPVIGDWEDYTGSGVVNNVFRKGTQNELFGNKADIYGHDREDVSKRGNKKSTHRQRQHEEYIEL